MKKEIIEVKKKAIADGVPIVMDEALEAIKEVLLKNNPGTILEIGTATGYSAICFSNILENKCTIDTIELSISRANEAKENIEAARVTG